MALTQRLEIRQSHALVMTPQLMQAIKLLQLSNLDLAAYVEGELERNPLLERTGEGDADAPAAEREASSAADGAAADWAAGGRVRQDGATPERPAADLDDIPPADSDAARTARRRRAIPNGPESEPAVARTATTISRPSFPSRRRWPIISPSNSRSRWSIPRDE